MEKETIVWVALGCWGPDVRDWALRFFNVGSCCGEQRVKGGNCMIAGLESFEKETREVFELGALRVMPVVPVEGTIYEPVEDAGWLC